MTETELTAIRNPETIQTLERPCHDAYDLSLTGTTVPYDMPDPTGLQSATQTYSKTAEVFADPILEYFLRNREQMAKLVVSHESYVGDLYEPRLGDTRGETELTQLEYESLVDTENPAEILSTIMVPPLIGSADGSGTPGEGKTACPLGCTVQPQIELPAIDAPGTELNPLYKFTNGLITDQTEEHLFPEGHYLQTDIISAGTYGVPFPEVLKDQLTPPFTPRHPFGVVGGEINMVDRPTASYIARSAIHAMRMVWSHNNILQDETALPAGQLGGHLPGYQLCLNQAEHFTSSPMPMTPSSGSSTPSSETQRTCDYLSPENVACNESAGARHWATVHALHEAKEMLKGKLGWFQGTIIYSKEKWFIAQEYLAKCPYEGCAGNPQRVYPRPDVFKRHLIEFHREEKEDAAVKVDGLKVNQVSPEFRNAWEELAWKMGHQFQ